MELKLSVEDRLRELENKVAGMQQSLHDLKHYIMNDTHNDIEKLEKKIENLQEKNAIKFKEIREQIKSQFKWTILMFLTFFATTVTLIVGLR